MATGTDQLVELKGIYNGIIKRLGKLVAIFYKNGYHSIKQALGDLCLWVIAGQTFQGEACYF